MKKIFLIAVILFCFSITYGQDTKTIPTRQETMDWLAGKMKQYLDTKYTLVSSASRRYFDSYSNGKFVYEVIAKADDGETRCGFIKITIHLDRITKLSTGLSIYEGREDNVIKTYRRLIAQGNNIITKDYSNYYKTRCEYDENTSENKLIFGKWDSEDNESDDAVFRFDLETGLRERVIKALNNLIEYNIGKSEKKEVY